MIKRFFAVHAIGELVNQCFDVFLLIKREILGKSFVLLKARLLCAIFSLTLYPLESLKHNESNVGISETVTRHWNHSVRLILDVRWVLQRQR